jgi:trk system potassium uptake protein
MFKNGIVNPGIVFRIISRNLFIISVALLLCTGIAIIYSENILPFILASATTFIIGIVLYLLSPPTDNKVSFGKREAYLSVTLSWLLVTLTGSLPYIFSDSIPSVTDAVFESVSGFTTTGSSILTDIEILPRSILFWRSLTHWIGGIGIVVLFIIIMPSLNAGGYQLFTLESSLQEKILPRIKSVGQRLLFIYITLTTAEILLLLIGGMNLFESVCHAFGTVATGGFSPKNSSIASYSPYIQYVIMIFMLLSGINYVIHYYLIKRDFRKIQANEEVRFYFYIVISIGLVITTGLFFMTEKSLEESFRESFFQVISIITCTGFATTDYMLWPVFAWMTIFLAMFLGGCTGSTAGGIKMARHLLLVKNIYRSFREMIHPKALSVVRLNNNVLSEETNRSILSYISAYFIIFIAGSLLLGLTGLDGGTAASSAATAMAGIGPGIGTVGPAANFAHLSDFAKIVLSILMLLGRLEIYSVIMLIIPATWKQ